MVAALAFCVIVNVSKSQIATFTNSLPCDVTVDLVEVRAGAPGGCGPGFCGGTSVTIPANNSVTYDLGLMCSPFGPFNDLCMYVSAIGGCVPFPTRHLTAGCHGSVTMDTGTLSPTCCGPTTWTATWQVIAPLTFHIN